MLAAAIAKLRELFIATAVILCTYMEAIIDIVYRWRPLLVPSHIEVDLLSLPEDAPWKQDAGWNKDGDRVCSTCLTRPSKASAVPKHLSQAHHTEHTTPGSDTAPTTTKVLRDMCMLRSAYLMEVVAQLSELLFWQAHWT